MLPKAIREFDGIEGGPAASDKLLLDASASRFGSATVEDVVAAVGGQERVWPYLLGWDGSDHAGSGSTSTKVAVSTVTVPAGTLSANGEALLVMAALTGADGDDQWNVELNGVQLANASDGANVYATQVFRVVRTGATTGVVLSDIVSAEVSELNWGATQSLVVKAATGITLKYLRVVAEPS